MHARRKFALAAIPAVLMLLAIGGVWTPVRHAQGAVFSVGTVQLVAQTSLLRGIDCPTSTDCYAVGTQVRANATVGAVIVPVASGISNVAKTWAGFPPAGSTCATSSVCYAYLSGIACPTANCFAVGLGTTGPAGGAVLPINNGVAGTAKPEAGVSYPSSIACPTSSGCFAVGTMSSQGKQWGAVVSLTNGSSGNVQPAAGTSDLSSIACATSSVCYAVGMGVHADGTSAGVVAPVNNGVPGVAVPVLGLPYAPSVAYVNAIACPTSTACYAVGKNVLANGTATGAVVSIANGSVVDVQPVPGTHELYGIACSTSDTCFAAGNNDLSPKSSAGVVVSLTSGSVDYVQSVAAASILRGIACPSSTLCVAVGQACSPSVASSTCFAAGSASTGGVSSTGIVVPVTSASVAASAWVTLSPMPTARSGLAAAAGSDGRIYAIGGAGVSTSLCQGILATVEAYSAATTDWTTAMHMPTARVGLAATAGPDGRIYAIGGGVCFVQGNVLQNAELNEVEAFNPATNAWTLSAVPPLPTARNRLAAATSPDGRIYAIGGHMIQGGDNSGGLSFQTDVALNTVEAYSLLSGRWTAAAPLPTARWGLAAASGPDGLIYAIGGTDSSGAVLDTVEAYDPKIDLWAPVAPMPTARYDLAAAAGPDGLIYAIGGHGKSANALNTVEVYDPTTNSWTSVDPLHTARSSLAAAAGSDGRIYAIGGADATFQPLDTVEAYQVLPALAVPLPGLVIATRAPSAAPPLQIASPLPVPPVHVSGWSVIGKATSSADGSWSFHQSDSRDLVGTGLTSVRVSSAGCVPQAGQATVFEAHLQDMHSGDGAWGAPLTLSPLSQPLPAGSAFSGDIQFVPQAGGTLIYGSLDGVPPNTTFTLCVSQAGP